MAERLCHVILNEVKNLLKLETRCFGPVGKKPFNPDEILRCAQNDNDDKCASLKIVFSSLLVSAPRRGANWTG